MSWICPRCRADYPAPRERCEADGWRLVENLAGRVIGERYAIEKLIGVGGMRSAVWRAMQQPTGRPVAVKVLPATNKEEAKRFERGARIASNLNHPHITTVHDYGSTPDGAFFLVMELLEGVTLQQLLRQQQVSILDALVITDQILRALEHAHAHNVVHRDLKPANLFLTRKNDDIYFVKIMDFGLAKLATSLDEPDDDDAIGEDDRGEATPRAGRGEAFEPLVTPELEELNDITQARRICGTPEYLAPEPILGGPLDRRTDLYALGVILYRMLSGSLPFKAKVRHELYQQHLAAPVPPFGGSAKVPDAVARVVMKALSKRQADRFVDAAEMRVSLRAANRAIASELGLPTMGVFQSEVSAVKPTLPSSTGTMASGRPPRSRPWWIAAALLLVVGGAVGGIVLASSGSTEREASVERPERSATTPVRQTPVAPAPIASAPIAPPPPAPPSPPREAPAAHAPVSAEVGTSAPATTAEPAAVIAPAAPATKGPVSIGTTPGGVEVWHEGVALGTTPLSTTLPLGPQTLTLRGRGVAPREVAIEVTAEREVVLDLELPVAAPGRASTRRSPTPSERGPSAAAAPPTGTTVEAPARPEVTVLGDGAPRAEAKVLGRDIVDERPTVKILGEDLAPPPEVRARVLGQ
ncbi:MAG: serine/threonine protein kinase [Deltaproteobacteria bacterium]|nr:serine/threonine protein kinase [Deltaproteobacteria bacterium]